MLAAAGLLAVVLGGLLVPLASSTAHHTFDEARTDETTAGAVLAAQVSDSVARAARASAEPAQPGPAVTSAVSAVVRATGMRVLVVDGSRPRARRRRPEAPVAGGVTRTDAGLEQVLNDRYVAPRSGRPFCRGRVRHDRAGARGREVVGAVQVARPMSVVRSRTTSRDLALGGLGLVALAAGICVAALLSTRLTRPVRRLG